MTPMHKTILELGRRGQRVRVYIQGDLVRVRWREHGRRRTESWPNTPENRITAKAYAEGILDGLLHPDPPVRPKLTLRAIWERYAEAEFPSLRSASQRRYLERWQKWERFMGRDFLADETQQEDADRYRTARTALGIVVNQIAEEVKMAKLVYAWAQRRKLITQNELALYRFKIAKEDRPSLPAEYRLEDFEKILAQFDSTSWGRWRPWAVLTLLGNQGVRTGAALHLAWDDVDLETGLLTWRARWDKVGREWQQPIRTATRHALEVCRKWREKLGYEGQWVFFSQDERKVKGGELPIYGQAALGYALGKAEQRAGVPHLDLRAMHGLRRMVVGEIVRLTGDVAAAAQFIGDTDLRVVNRSYLKRRIDQLVAVAARLDAAPKDQPSGNQETSAKKDEIEVIAEEGDTESHWSDSNRRPLDYESRALPLSYSGGDVGNALARIRTATPFGTTPSR